MSLEPRANPHLVAHGALLAQCLTQRARGQMHHAYLLCGAKGTGKATLAYHLARELLAEGAVSVQEEAPSMGLFGDALPATPAPAASPHDAESALFRRVAAGSHTDLLTISPVYDAKKGTEKAEIGVDVARQLSEFLSLTPAESKWRVVVIDAVDQLNANAANAILKMLEEPPGFSVLLLVCHNPEAILPTIRSRCQVLRVTPPSLAQFGEIMQFTSPNIATRDVAALYALAQGSVGMALSLHEHKAHTLYHETVKALKQPSGKLPNAIEQCLNAKSPLAWQTMRYVLELLAHRVLVPTAIVQEIFEGEAKEFATIRSQHSQETWFMWQRAMVQLLQETTVFHLDKRATLRLVYDPARLLAFRAA